MDQNNINDTMQNTQPINEQVQNTQQINPQPTIQPQYIQVSSDSIPEEYKPISMWGYFGYELLFSIPLIGFILILVFSFGGARNINLRNFARSYFCFLIIGLIVGGIILLFALLLTGSVGLSSIGSGAVESTKTMY